MECSRDKGVSGDSSRAGSEFHGDKEEQAAMGSCVQQDEPKGFSPKPRTVQVQVEKPRHQGCETMEPEALRQQFPFYNELQVIFATRMQRMLWAEAEGGGSSSKKKLSSDDEDDNNNNINEDSEGDQKGGGGGGGSKKKKKKGKIIGNYSGSNSSNLSNLKEMLEEFMRQQMQIEAQWMEVYEARENERRMKEIEWRQTMEALEKEKIMMDQRWREREEQRRVREEARAEKRDALINALLNKLTRQDM
ncbi:trihelix transcription factor GT-3b-like [Senna tora]|uniref:Trihelix transcription factor GT-3b-like n=1 Tax=Senna tora TaxID=362788 RepID=A0A834XLE8_9FABA|nr:trihelix transcription factor GT-3b-like [Senna tora]